MPRPGYTLSSSAAAYLRYLPSPSPPSLPCSSTCAARAPALARPLRSPRTLRRARRLRCAAWPSRPRRLPGVAAPAGCGFPAEQAVQSRAA